ncbi:DUF3108 domain-containing protein [Variovorax rhizosphaerae]|uniref:DUF3108 domain-containing protein n=1 Tax=Variovorax rhizosphaerae TaxID=1836200 RepID=A0ABU8WWX0_9BURK
MTPLPPPRNLDAASLPADGSQHARRMLALLTLGVLAAHLLVLGLIPTGVGPEQLPLENKFITRTIVITPPAAKAEAPAPAAASPPPPPRVAKPTPPKRPRAITPPRTEPAPAPPPVLAAQTSADPLPVEPAPDVPVAAASPALEGASAGEGSGTAPEGGTADGSAGGVGSGAGEVTTGATQPLVLPGSVKLSFEVGGQRGAQPYSGGYGELVWLQDGDEYNARLSMKALFMTFLSQTSVGRVDASGIAPTRYSEKRRSEVASHLVRDQGKVVFSNNSPTVPLLPGAQDRLSVAMQLGALLAGDASRFPQGSKIRIQTVGPKDAEVWVFNVEGEETIEVIAGEFKARKLSRAPRRDFDYQLELWLAPEIGYLPVRIQQKQANGDIIDMRLRAKTTP